MDHNTTTGGKPRFSGGAYAPPENYAPFSGPYGSPPLYRGPSSPPGAHLLSADAVWRGDGPYLGQPGMIAGVPPGYSGWVAASAPRRTLRWWLLGGLGVCVVVAVVVGVVAVSSARDSANVQATTTTSAPVISSVPPVPVSALDGLLPSAADVAAVVSAPPLVSLMKPAESHAFYDDLIVDNDCVGVAFAATQSLYEGSGWVSMRKQVLGDTTDDTALRHSVTEAVVAFPDAAAALKFYHRALDAFHKCANRNINVREMKVPDTGRRFLMVGRVSEKDGVLAAPLVWEGGDGWICQRGVSMQNNIVVDISACGYSISDSVTPALVKPIISKIGTAR